MPSIPLTIVCYLQAWCEDTTEAEEDSEDGEWGETGSRRDSPSSFSRDTSSFSIPPRLGRGGGWAECECFENLGHVCVVNIGQCVSSLLGVLDRIPNISAPALHSPLAQGGPWTGPWGPSASPAQTTARGRKYLNGRRLIPKTADPDLSSTR